MVRSYLASLGGVLLDELPGDLADRQLLASFHEDVPDPNAFPERAAEFARQPADDFRYKVTVEAFDVSQWLGVRRDGLILRGLPRLLVVAEDLRELTGYCPGIHVGPP